MDVLAGARWIALSERGRKDPGGHAMRDYTAVMEREASGRYAVHIPDLPGVASMGDTRREALANITEAIACSVEGMKKLGRPLPGRRSRVELVRVKAV